MKVLETAHRVLRPFAWADFAAFHRRVYADPAVAPWWTGRVRTAAEAPCLASCVSPRRTALTQRAGSGPPGRPRTVPQRPGHRSVTPTRRRSAPARTTAPG